MFWQYCHRRNVICFFICELWAVEKEVSLPIFECQGRCAQICPNASDWDLRVALWVVVIHKNLLHGRCFINQNMFTKKRIRRDIINHRMSIMSFYYYWWEIFAEIYRRHFFQDFERRHIFSKPSMVLLGLQP